MHQLALYFRTQPVNVRHLFSETLRIFICCLLFLLQQQVLHVHSIHLILDLMALYRHQTICFISWYNFLNASRASGG